MSVIIGKGPLFSYGLKHDNLPVSFYYYLTNYHKLAVSNNTYFLSQLQWVKSPDMAQLGPCWVSLGCSDGVGWTVFSSAASHALASSFKILAEFSYLQL